MPTTGHLDLFLTGKAYTIAQAAVLTHTTPQTARRWVLGYKSEDRKMKPVFGGDRSRGAGPLMVSFLELVEIAVVARFRRGAPGHNPVTLERLRRAHAFARDRFHTQYPFASLKLWEVGGHVLHEFEAREPGPAVIALDMHGQAVLPGLVERVQQSFRFEDEIVHQWYPHGPGIPIVIDPRVSAGQPVLEATGVRVEIIFERFRAGEDIQALAIDFEVDEGAVEEALRYAAA